MKKIAAYLIPVLACFAVGISASFFQASSIAEWYPTLTKPTLTPPNIVFPIAWSVLYLCMGLSRVVYSDDYRSEEGLDLLRRVGIECVQIEFEA